METFFINMVPYIQSKIGDKNIKKIVVAGLILIFTNKKSPNYVVYLLWSLRFPQYTMIKYN